MTAGVKTTFHLAVADQIEQGFHFVGNCLNGTELEEPGQPLMV